MGRHAKVRKDSNLLAEYHHLYGKIYEAAGNYLVSKQRYLQSLRIQEVRGYDLAMARLYAHLSNVESLQLNRGEALRYARLGVKIAERSKSDEAILRANGSYVEVFIGTVYGLKSHTFSMSLGHLASFFPPECFFCISRSLVVNKELLRNLAVIKTPWRESLSLTEKR